MENTLKTTSINTENKRNKKRTKTSYHIGMQKKTINKIQSWIEQANKYFDGLVRVSVSDVCESILQGSPEELPKNILSDLENKKFSTSLKLKMLLKRASEAEKMGQGKTLDELLKEHGDIVRSSKKTKKVRNKIKKEEAVSELKTSQKIVKKEVYNGSS